MKKDMNTCEATKYQWFCWRFNGISVDKTAGVFYKIYAVLVSFFVTFYYPFSLFLGVLFLTNFEEILENWNMNVTLLAYQVKIINLAVKKFELFQLNDISNALDKLAKTPEEEDRLKAAKTNSTRLFFIFVASYTLAVLGLAAIVLASKEPRLMYEAWFPFDWKASHRNYCIAIIYQFVGITFFALGNLGHDTYSPAYINILNAHLECLYIRIKRIGNNAEHSLEDNYKELIDSIYCHKLILRYVDILEGCTSIPILAQFAASATVLCICAIYALFADYDLFKLGFAVLYAIAITMQIFVFCYYGSQYNEKANDLTHVIYSLNWTIQNTKFRKMMIIFMQRSQRVNMFRAGYWIPVSLPTFAVIARLTYSALIVLRRIAF